jgi:hypothetical protein
MPEAGHIGPFDALWTWVAGLERIRDANRVVAILVRNEVSLASLALFTVKDLADMGIPKSAAKELLAQLSVRHDVQSAHMFYCRCRLSLAVLQCSLQPMVSCAKDRPRTRSDFIHRK